jgi:hypothetical protein
VIGHCSACGLYGEIDLLPVPNGAQRTLCHACASGGGAPRLPTPDRFRLLVGRLRTGSLVPGEERDLRFALEGILARSQGRAGAARHLLEEMGR